MSTTAVVFAYGEVGIRCLKVLVSGGVDVRLVVTHDDDPNEFRWFDSVAELAADYGLPCITPDNSREPLLNQRLALLAPDFIFSFYYRFLLSPEQLKCARRRALNMHGSLLPYFRGRAPVNWAILHGSTETGATLHEMVPRADAGDIVDQQTVPILADDDALAVSRKVTVAAEIILHRSLPALIDGSARATPQVLSEGSYFGRRRPEDGRIDWSRSARDIHNLIRAVAPPYPGAFADIGGERWIISRARPLDFPIVPPASRMRLIEKDGHCVALCGDGSALRLLAAHSQGGPIDITGLSAQLRWRPVDLRPSQA